IRREVAAEARAGVETTEETTDFYVATANEGDSRDWPFYSEESRAKDLDLDPAVFSPTAGDDAELGRLTVTTTLGDRDNDGLYEALYAFGGRSMSLLDADARMVFDTGDQLEQLSISLDPGSFNKDNDSSNIDNRSDNKGPEPEAVATGEVGDTTYAFLAAERSGMIYAFDVSSTPGEALFAGWINSREDDLGPEGMVFLSSSESPNGSPMLLVTYEITGTVGLYSLSQDS
ncbi:MAG: choice-of-anchor I domain-containing protein, partial [Solirubrobacterales bacterium]